MNRERPSPYVQNRELTGKEYDNIMLLLKFIDPDKESDNQHILCEEYTLNSSRYQILYWESQEKPMLLEIYE
jgi:hypothetical protein